jgi:hypothetical protein
MIEFLVLVVLLIGLVVLAVGAVRSILTGRLEPYSSWMRTAGKPPILRSASPWKFWGLWAAQAWVSLVPAAVILIALFWR